jgi:uncharacterized membrane protein YfcA
LDFPGIETLLFLIVAGFAAAFIDSVVGGGGLISVPALMLTGLPPSMVLGTNKFGGTLSSLTSTASFLLSGKIKLKLVLALFPLSFIGSAIGTYCVKQVPSEFLKPIVVILLVVMTAYTLMKKNWQAASAYRRPSGWKLVLVSVMALVIGFYDGFFGPGTGSFLLFMFLLLGFDFVSSSANAKVLNLASNMSSLATFLWLDSVNLGYGIPMGAAMILGAVAGSQVAIRKGSTYVKPLFVTVTLLLVGNQLWSILP